MEKPDVLPIPNVVTINELKVLLTSITCLPSYPIERRYLPYSSPYRVYMLHPTSKWPTRPLSHSLYPGYKSGLRAPLQRQFSLELARCSNSISHSNKLYFPLILSHVWKFFSNPHLYHDTYYVWHYAIYLPWRKKNIKIASKSPQCQHSNHIFLGF